MPPISAGGGHNISETPLVICYNNNVTHANSLWRAENPVASTLPFFASQLCLIIFSSRILIFLLKPLRQPPIVAEILAGVLLGPSGLQMEEFFKTYVFAFRSLLALETVANLSLVYYIFLVGLELDITPIMRAGGKAFSIAILGLLIPMPIGAGLHIFITGGTSAATSETKNGPLFFAIALATTNFPDLSRVLSDLKLLHSEIGRTALSATIITDLCTWVLLVLVMSISHYGQMYSIFSTLFFVLFCIFVLRPALKWIVRVSRNDGTFNDFHICFIMTGVVACGLATDACGSHSIVGAFMWGVIMPKGELRDMILAKVEDLVKSILLPTFFLVVGFRTNIWEVSRQTDWSRVVVAVFFSAAAKIISTSLVAIFCNFPLREGLALGSLMNTKGLLALIIICVGRDLKALGDMTFTVMLISYWSMTAMIGPTLSYAYNSVKSARRNSYRTIQCIQPDGDFRIVVCVHSTRHVGGIIHLLEASFPTKQSPLLVFAIHLVELTGRATAMLIVHGQCKSTSAKTKAQTDHIINAFDTFESDTPSATVHSLTAVSPYATMHDDICGIAAEKRVNLIILPFHKQPTVDGGLEDENPSIGMVNSHVMANAPCSVGVLVDRGFATFSLTESNRSGRLNQRFAVFFIGGPDDREALAYSWRMSQHPGITVTVVRFLPGDEVKETNIADFPGEENVEILTAIAGAEREKIKDSEFMQHFRAQILGNPAVTYIEKVVNNGDETLRAISSMESEHSLYIVGKGRGISPLVSGLSEWSDSPELGVLGDALVTSSFTANVSILVVQQGEMEEDGGGGKDNDGGFLTEQYENRTWQASVKKSSDFEPLKDDDEEKGKGYYQLHGSQPYPNKL